MPWSLPEHSREEVNRAARNLIKTLDEFTSDPEPGKVSGFLADKWLGSFDVVGNWRTSHSWPLNTFKLWLLTKAKQVDEHTLVAQRLKRLSSIMQKLRRFPNMKLSQMQDIAGCRAILGSVASVYDLVALYKKSDIKHKLVHEDDYISAPKESGYRGVHLVYAYNSDK